MSLDIEALGGEQTIITRSIIVSEMVTAQALQEIREKND